MSVDLRKDFAEAGYDLANIEELFRIAYQLNDGESMYGTQLRYTSEGISYAAWGGSAFKCIRGWMDAMEDAGYSTSEAGRYIHEHLTEVAETRLNLGDEPANRLIFGKEPVSQRVDGLMSAIGASREEFGKYLSQHPDYFDKPYGSGPDFFEKMSAQFGEIKALSMIQGEVGAIANRQKIELGSTDMMTALDESMIKIQFLPHHHKLQASFDAARERREHLKEIQDYQTGVLKEVTQKKESVISVLYGARESVVGRDLKQAHKRIDLNNQIRKYVLDRSKSTLDRDMRKVAKKLENKAQITRVDNFWRSPEGRIREANILKTAAILSHATRKMHSKVISDTPTKQDADNALKVFLEIRKSGSISKATAWAGIHSVISKATDQCSKKAGIELKEPRVGEVYSSIRDEKMTKKDAIQSVDLDAKEESLSVKDRIAISKIADDPGFKKESATPDIETEKDAQAIDRARDFVKPNIETEPETKVESLTPDRLKEEDIQAAESYVYDKDRDLLANEVDSSLEKSDIGREREKMVDDLDVDPDYQKSRERHMDQFDGRQSSRDDEMKKERQQETRKENAKTRDYKKDKGNDEDIAD